MKMSLLLKMLLSKLKLLETTKPNKLRRILPKKMKLMAKRLLKIMHAQNKNLRYPLQGNKTIHQKSAELEQNKKSSKICAIIVPKICLIPNLC